MCSFTDTVSSRFKPFYVVRSSIGLQICITKELSCNLLVCYLTICLTKLSKRLSLFKRQRRCELFRVIFSLKKFEIIKMSRGLCLVTHSHLPIVHVHQVRIHFLLTHHGRIIGFCRLKSLSAWQTPYTVIATDEYDTAQISSTTQIFPPLSFHLS